MDRPNCECHDEPMFWNRDPRYTAGGFWYCAVRRRERDQRRYWADPIAEAARKDRYRRAQRIARLESQLKELT